MNSQYDNGVWMCGDGRRIPIEQLSDEHLINILNYRERLARCWVGHERDEYYQVQHEARRRGLQWWFYKRRRLQDGELQSRPTFRGTPTPTPPPVMSPRQVRNQGTVPLSALAPGCKFRRTESDVPQNARHVYIVLNPVGAIATQMAMGSNIFQDDVHRVLVTNEWSGRTFYLPGYEHVLPV